MTIDNDYQNVLYNNNELTLCAYYKVGYHYQAKPMNEITSVRICGPLA